MPIDTAAKRASSLGALFPDGTIAQADRQTILEAYGGILVEGVDRLTAQNIVIGAPVITQAEIGQTHELVAQNIAIGPPTISQPALGVHALVAQDIVIGAPVITQAVLAQTHIMAAADIEIGDPYITQATLSTMLSGGRMWIAVTSIAPRATSEGRAPAATHGSRAPSMVLTGE